MNIEKIERQTSDLVGSVYIVTGDDGSEIDVVVLRYPAHQDVPEDVAGVIVNYEWYYDISIGEEDDVPVDVLITEVLRAYEKGCVAKARARIARLEGALRQHGIPIPVEVPPVPDPVEVPS
jgi:hypothetical protein